MRHNQLDGMFAANHHGFFRSASAGVKQPSSLRVAWKFLCNDYVMVTGSLCDLLIPGLGEGIAIVNSL